MAAWLRLAACLVIALAGTFGAPGASPAAEPPAGMPRVLLLLSYHPTFPTSAKIIAGVREGFGDQPVDLQVVYMHTRFDASAPYLARFADWLRIELARGPPDVVIAADDNAARFALDHGPLLNGAPLVFLGVNDVATARFADNLPGVTGIVEDVSIRETLTLIRKALPKADRIHVIADGSAGGRADLKRLIDLRDDFPDLLIIPYKLQEMQWSDLAAGLRQIPPSEPVLLLAAYQDATGAIKQFDQSVRYLLANTQAPIFHLWAHGIPEGLVGGFVMSHRRHGQIAARMARQILAGTPAGDIPVRYESPNLPLFNAAALIDRNIPLSALPPDAQLVNEPSTILGTYPRLVTGAVLVFLVMATLLIALIRANRHRSRLLKTQAQQHALLNSLLDASPDMIFFKDLDGRFGMVNATSAAVLGKRADEVMGTDDYDYFPTDEAEEFRAIDREVMDRGTPIRRTELIPQRDGGNEIFDTLKAPVRGADGTVFGLFGIARRVTTEYQTSDRLQLAAQVFEHAAEGIMITSPAGVIEIVNPAFTRITGYTPEEVCGKNPAILHSGRHNREFYERMWATVDEADLWQGEVWNRRKSGEVYPEWLNISPVRDDRGQVVHYLGIFSDISAVKHSEERLEHIAHHDALTGLPNRVLLNDRIDTALRRAQRSDTMVAVVFLDLDRFKDINDSFGHATGDLVLKQVASRISETVREEDTVARLGGDEFVILMEDIDDAAFVEQASQRIVTCLNPPISAEHQEFFIGASLGISVFPRDGNDAESLIRNADTAMYQAKREGRNAIQQYSEKQTEAARQRMRLETALRRAVEHEAFEVWLQPQVELGAGALTGFEALCRWRDPERGMVPPSDFIPVAEATGLIIPIGEFMLRRVARLLAAWHATYERVPRIAVNVSGRQLRRLDFLSSVCTILEEEQCRPDWIELEVTESDILKDAEPAIATLYGIREMGIGLSLDDFGTGFSSLSYLKRLPIEMIKIDRSFIDGLPGDANDRAIVQAVLAMGRSLGLRVLAEGVETPAQVSALRLMGCTLAQGYRFGKPAVPDTFLEMVQAGRLTLNATA